MASPAVRKLVEIFADGACRGNPGPGGYGAIVRFEGRELVLSCGYRRTTNNRMELRGVIAALERLKYPCRVLVWSDSKYVVESMTKHWHVRWVKNGWQTRDGKPVANADLWRSLVALSSTHDTEFRWVRGHAGHAENERCDALAAGAAASRDLQIDVGYDDVAARISGSR